MNIRTWTPFRDMEGLFDRYHRLGTERDGEGGLVMKDFDWRPSADISETDEQYIIKATLPEVEKEDVHIAVDDGMLTISGERHYKSEEESEKQHRVESMYGKFSRSFTLPADVDQARIKAESKNGIVKVQIPKVVKDKPKTIEISVD